MMSRSAAGPQPTIGIPSKEDRSFEAPPTVVDPAPFRGARARPPSTEVAVAQLEASYAATRESREVVELLAAHEMSLARERRAATPPVPPSALGLTMEVSDDDIEAELSLSSEELEDAAPTSVREPTPAFHLPRPLPLRVIELPLRRPTESPAPAPSWLARLRGLPTPVQFALLCAWLVLVGAVGVVSSRAVWRVTSPAAAVEAATSGAGQSMPGW